LLDEGLVPRPVAVPHLYIRALSVLFPCWIGACGGVVGTNCEWSYRPADGPSLSTIPPPSQHAADDP